MSAISYRKDIDGLRALAVVAVILGHAKFSLFSGGFVGVDIFFVISGFLITSIVTKEISTGRFTLKSFYLRRIKRIMPALTVVTACTLAAGWLILFPTELIILAKTAFASLTAWNNFLIENITSGYWRRSTEEIALMHTWSLGIEEQFYLIWPFMLLLFLKIKNIKYFKLICISVLILSIAISQLLVPYVVFSYFLLPSRFFELFLGCSAALLFQKPIALKGHADKLNYLGLALMLVPIFVYWPWIPFPGFNALWPCLGAVLILIPKVDSNNYATRLLSAQPIVFIGKISYSLYLWHWPFFSFLSYLGQPTEKYRWEIIAITFVLSVITYYFVEQPARKSKRGLSFFFSSYFAAPAVISLFLCYNITINEGYLGRFPSDIQPTISAVESVIPTPGQSLNSDVAFVDQDMVSDVDVILFGDSHAHSMQGFMEVLLENASLKGVLLSKTSRLYLKNMQLISNKKTLLKNMVAGDFAAQNNKKNLDVYNKISNSKAKYVVVAGRYSSYNEGSADPYAYAKEPTLTYKNKLLNKNNGVLNDMECFKKGLRDTVKYIISIGKTPIVFKDVPELPERLYLNSALNKVHNINLPEKVDKAYVMKNQAFVDNTIDQLSRTYPELIVIEPKKLISSKDKFLTIINDIPLYQDKHHINHDASRLLGKKWVKEYGNPFLGNTKKIASKTQ